MLVSTIILVSLNFDAQKVEGLLMWVQDNPRQGSFLFLVRSLLAAGQRMFGAETPEPCCGFTCCHCGHLAHAHCHLPNLKL